MRLGISSPLLMPDIDAYQLLAIALHLRCVECLHALASLWRVPNALLRLLGAFQSIHVLQRFKCSVKNHCAITFKKSEQVQLDVFTPC